MAVRGFWRGLGEDIRFLKNRRYNEEQTEREDILRGQNRMRRSSFVLYGGLLFWGLLAGWAMLNVLAVRLPPSLNIDASDDELYSLSEATQNILAELKDEVTIYALFSEGQRPTRPLDIWRYLELYQSESPYIRIEEVDPALEPERIRPFITGRSLNSRSSKERTYAGRGENKAPQKDSLIVFTRGQNSRFRVIHYEELYYVIKRFGPKNASIRAEQQLGAAIAYVNGANITRLGLLSGHREQTLASIEPNFSQFNIEQQELALLPVAAQGLEELDVILVYKPQLDLSEAEYQALRGFFEAGKALWLILDFEAEYLPRFYQLAKDYGIEILEGLVLERDSSRIQAASGYTTFISPLRDLPRLDDGKNLHPITRPLQEGQLTDLLWVQSMAVRESLPKPRRLRFYSLVESSDASLLRGSRDPSWSVEMEGDLRGPLSLMGLSVWQNEKGERSGPALLVSFDQPGERSTFSTPSNLQLFYSAIAWLGQPKGQESQLVFPSKSLLMLPLRLSQAQAIWWAAGFVLFLPLGVLLAGLLFLRHRSRL